MLDFTMTWLSTYLFHSTLLLGAAWGIGRLLGARATALRTHLWRAALVGALVTATLQSVGLVTRLPQADLDAQALRAAFASATSTPEIAPVAAPASRASTAPRAAPSHGVAAVAPRAEAKPWAALPRAVAADWTTLLLGLWLAGVAFGLARLAVLGLLAHRELADRAAAPALLGDELSQLARAQQMACPALSVSANLGGPVSLPNGEIVVPEWCLELSPAQRRALLAHELAHQRNADPQWLALALLVHSLLWIQPLLGLARRELAAAAELEADAWAARAVDDPRALAECLARCAEHLVADRAALFGAAMADGSAGRSPLLERIDRLLEGVHMKVKDTPVVARVLVVLALAGGVFVLPGLAFGERILDSGDSIHISTDDDSSTTTISRKGYKAKLEVEGKYTLDEAETDLATLTPGGEFKLYEKLAGEVNAYSVKADREGKLTRGYERDGKAAPLDAKAKQWLAQALPRIQRETALDAEGRVARILKRGGPAAVFAEIDLIGSDFAKARYLGALLAKAQLSAPDLERALTIAQGIGSDYEKRQALSAALEKQTVAPAQMKMMLQAGATIGSDYERAELLTAAAKHIGSDDGVRAAWLAAADGIGSDYELRRTLETPVQRRDTDPRVVAGVIAVGGKRISSDFELRSLLSTAAPAVGADRALAEAYLAAAGEIGSDFERREALIALLDVAKLDSASLDGVLVATAAMGSDFEQGVVLDKLANKVAGDAALAKRYRDVARGLSEHERGEALKALDDAMQL